MFGLEARYCLIIPLYNHIFKKESFRKESIATINTVPFNSWTSPVLENYVTRKTTPSGAIFTFVGFLCLTWLLIIIFVPFPSVHFISKDPEEDISYDRKGHLVVYPTTYRLHYGESVKYDYIINLEDTSVNFTENASSEIEQILSGYPSSSEIDRSAYTDCLAGKNPSEAKPCFFSRAWLGNNCLLKDKFGYNLRDGTFSPCFLVRIEGTTDWTPDTFTADEVGFLENYNESRIALLCRPRNNNENGTYSKIIQSPALGFPREFFPMFNTSLVPAVMVQVLEIKRGTKLEIECTLRIPNAFMLEDSGMVYITFQQ